MSEVTTAESNAKDDAENTVWKMTLGVEISDIGPCRKRIEVKVPEADISHVRTQLLDDYTAKAQVPGFRVGRVPRDLVIVRFRQQLADELKQRVLVQSLEQLTSEHSIDPINEPDMDVEAIEIPDAGDFAYAFEVEVRPDVTIPDYGTLTIKRPARAVSEEDVEKYLTRMLQEYAVQTDSTEPVQAGDAVTVAIQFEHKNHITREMSNLSVRVQPTLRFQDGEISSFDQLMAGAAVGETRTGAVTISLESPYVPMRGETLSAKIKVKSVKKVTPAVLDSALAERMGFDTVDALRTSVRNVLERHVTYRQRQSCRTQLLEQITESAKWELPEELVMKQVENALHREILEMKQAGYTPAEIRAREAALRQKSVSVTRQAMKEHFVLDKIATVENVEVTGSDIDTEIAMMAFQSGESPRRVRAKLEKSRVIENLEAQIRERKAVDIALERAKFEEVPLEEELVPPLEVEGIDDAICNLAFFRSSAATAQS